MTSRAIPVAVLVAALFSSGCGTIENFATPKDGVRTFGGVALDLQHASDLANGSTGGAGSPVGSGGGTQGTTYAAMTLAIVFAPFLDLPFSFIGDVITYPLARFLDSDFAH